jgi:hypothetical protein
MLGTPFKRPKTIVDAPSIEGALAVEVNPEVSLKLDKSWPPRKNRRSDPE